MSLDALPPSPKAARPDRRQFILGGALIATTVVTAAAMPRRMFAPISSRELEQSVPLQIGAYRFATSTGLVVPDLKAQAGIYDQVLTRIYVANGHPSIMLLIAYGSAQDDGLAVHRPEACYPSAGYIISQSTPVTLTGDVSVDGKEAATFLSASRGDRVEQVYFWTRIGKEFPSTAVEKKMDVLSANLRGTMPDGVLVRLSVLSNEREAALSALQAFNAELLRSITPSGRRLLLGEDMKGSD